MQFCQIKRKNIIFKTVIFFVFIFVYFFSFNLAKAGPFDIISNTLFDKKDCRIKSQASIDAIGQVSGVNMEVIQVLDEQGLATGQQMVCVTEKNGIARALDWIEEKAIDWAWKEFIESGAIAWRRALRFFLNQLAYDMATYLATGDKGQLPMFETEGWGGYLENVADSTAGAFIEELGKNMGVLKFNLCRPNADILLKINLGLDNVHRPRPPACTFSQLRDNWEAALNDKDFLPKFQDMFNPWSNDLGIALTLQTGMESEISRKVNEATQDRIEGKGWRPVRSLIEGRIKTPADLVGAAARQPIEDSTASEKVYTGQIVADSIDIFINTLIGKLIDKWLRDGLVTDFTDFTNTTNIRRWNSLTDPDAQNPDEGIAGAEGRFKSLVEPNFKVRAAYDILAELTICPDPNKAGPTNCVIDERFREAIEKRLTVGQAIEQGYLSANGVFGFTANGLEPKYNEGYPYRSMLILRKFRILPVGWEVAAQYIKDCQASASDPLKCRQGDTGGTKTLSEMVHCGAAWCADLVDPNWVLKAPPSFCAREGAGPEILSEQVSGEGAASSLSLLRNDNYCADEKSLIKEDSDGSNPYWGYCTEEKRIWDFNARSCAPRDNTCQTFSSADGRTVSYLQNTLDFGVCNAGNAGCAKYATNGSYDAAGKTVVWDGNNNPVYLNRSAESCEAADEGCRGFIRLTPDKNETYADIKNAGLNEAYNRFSQSGLIYEKLLPDYLVDKVNGQRAPYDKGACYDEQGRPRTLAPAICSNFVRQCQEAEAGCELYTSVTDGAKVPAKVAPGDYCPAACLGYDTFVQKETAFTASRVDYFIPKTAKTCSAESSGCEQFTNLDEVKKGGEGIEYYTYLRQCLAKAANADSCGEFYSWEGSDESGYQLKVESLKISDKVAAGEPVGGPAVTENDSTLCTEEIYNYPLSNPAHNSDCRQFYNKQGGVSYHLYKRTISCSDNCHPYRKTAADDGSCKGGGVFDPAKQACIYMAIPGQGQTCPAAENGCREYAGNTGNDLRNIFTDDFEGVPTLGGWRDGNDLMVGIEPSNVSLTLQNNIGHSMLVKVDNGRAAAKRTVGSAVRQGKAYVLSFLIKADGNTTLNIYLATSTNGSRAEFASVPITTDWQIYKTNLTNLEHTSTADEFLEITAGQNFYIDNIVLTEIVDRYYLIKDSWRDSCDYFEADTTKDYVGDSYYAGCDQYQNRAGQTHNLRQFSELCSEAAVGCELMIDTQNSSGPDAETFTKDGTVKNVPADEFTYVVYDQDKLCAQEAKGCALLGKSYNYENETLYGDVYLKNNPDKYNQILCGADAVGCQTFAYEGGEKWFKDPGDMVCEWRQEPNTTAGPRWFKKKVSRCGDNNGAVCLSDKDCSAGVKCQLETADRECPLDTDNGGLAKTLGKGGAGGQVSQPAGKPWAGVCAAANSGCGEYIDPVSRFNANIIFNGSFDDLDKDGIKTDGWPNLRQTINLEPNTVYRLARAAGAGSLTLSGCPRALYEIDENNNLIGPAASVAVEAAGYANSKIFYYKGGDTVSCTVSVGSSAGAVELKPVIIDYQLAQNLDKKSCNGVPDFSRNCVLFNERSQGGAGLLELKWDADTEKVDGSINDQDKDSNTILKVTPDRACDKWLACKSKIKDEKGNDVCYNIALCNGLDDKGDCASFINSPKTNQTLEGLGAAQISNLSGYAKVGLAGGSLGGDYYPLGAMEQKGEVANLANGGFEFYGSNDYPIGWLWSGGGAAKSWDENVFSVINNPIAAQTEGIGYAREGRAFLKLGSSYDATSEETDVLPFTDYIITAYSNTKNLKSGQAKIDILNSAGAVIQSAVIVQNLGNDWQLQVGQFKSGNNSTVKIKLYSSAGGPAASEGNFYFDDIKIRPALNSKDNWHTAQVCRLYPQTDSLACDYFEDSGKRQKGWPGYCLEYDRPPGDPNTCLLWYPVDRVKGDGFEEGVGYQGKFPVYYCLEAERPRELTGECVSFADAEGMKRSDLIAARSGGAILMKDEQEIILSEPYIVWDDAKDKIFLTEGGGHNLSIYGLALRNYFDQKWTGIVEGKADVAVRRERVWDLSVDFEHIKMFDAVKIYCIYGESHSIPPGPGGWVCECNSFGAESGIMSAARCNIVTQTVNSVGQNKFWSSRVYQGSDYKLSCNVSLPLGYATTTCSYGSDQTPFGSIVPPAVSLSSLYNPYEWDTKLAPGKQPIYYEVNNGQARMGQELSEATTKQIFAKTYGTWSWDRSVCQGGVKAGADCVNNYACQGACNEYRCVNTVTNSVISQDCDPDSADTCNNLDRGSCVKAVPSANVCLGGNKEFSVCATIGSNECKGCAGQTFGQCQSFRYCQGGPKDGQACPSSGGTAFCNNSCAGFNNGSCNATTLKCVGGNKAGNSCAINTCEADSFGIKRCVGGSKSGKYCSGNTDCDDCKGCAGSTYGACERLGYCQNGARNGLICNLNQGNDQCNTTTSSPDSTCANYNTGSCARKKVCDAGCNKDQVCNNNAALCSSTRCHECLVSLCSDGVTACSNNAACSGACSPAGYSSKAGLPAWGPPGTLTNAPLEPNNGLCPPEGRGAAYCAILPQVSKIKVQGQDSGLVELKTSQVINLTFNSKVDSQQLPLVMYAVEWGDNDKTVITGIEMRDRPEESGQEHSLYHLYSYWDLKTKVNSGIIPADSCTTVNGIGQCSVKPKIQIKDNWGWCNKGQTINICGDGQWDSFNGWVVVKER